MEWSTSKESFMFALYDGPVIVLGIFLSFETD